MSDIRLKRPQLFLSGRLVLMVPCIREFSSLGPPRSCEGRCLRRFQEEFPARPGAEVEQITAEGAQQRLRVHDPAA